MKVGYFCTFTPKELIHAAGFTPIRILPSDEEISLASAHLQSYACSHARGCLEKALRGLLDVEAVVFTRSCDTLMRLADIWERNTKMRVYSIEFPTRIDEKSKKFYERELADFASVLESWGGTLSVDKIRESIELYRELEEKLKRLFEVKADYELLMKVQEMDVGKALKLVDERINGIEHTENKPKILITGSVCPFIEVYKLFEDAGFVVKDDTCTGSRFFLFDHPNIEIKTLSDAYRYLAEKYFSKSPCPTKHFENDRRLEHVLKLAEDCEGVVFLLLKFCDPHFFDYPQLKEKLESMGKKTLLLELEFPIASYEQLRTRIEAFYEVIA